jgi:hypothetical protein
MHIVTQIFSMELTLVQQLSKLAVSHFTTANHTKSANAIISDLAILK